MPARSIDSSLALTANEMPESAWNLPPRALLLLVAGGIALLLLLVIKAKLHAFVALLVVSVVVAAVAGISPTEIPGLLEDGMGDTLGEIAIIVALGAMLGRMIQESGASDVLSGRLLAAFGERRAPLAVGLTALLFGIPVFFDVGFIILLPLIYSVAQRSGRSVISVALPAVGGLAIMHAVLPPHPGPVAAAGLLGANLGWVTIMGLVCGLPAWFVGAYLFGTRIGDRLGTPVPTALLGEAREQAGARGSSAGGGATTLAPPSLGVTVGVILLPVLLIMLNTFAGVVLPAGAAREALEFVGAPVIALTVATLLSFWVLGLRGGFSRERVEKAASASLGPVALVLLVTGAGGVFGAVLEATGAGQALADLLGGTSLPVVVLAFLIATALRVALGSKTVAIVTTAPIVAPLIQEMGLSQPEIALVVVAVAAGGTVLSHVNDSGFWLFNRYMDIDIRTTLQSWTLMETFMGGTAFLIAAVLSGLLTLV
ncbi:GntP family permease [Saccharopolyspora dendranthemae]|uniref:GntP family gluconate:H+ symporter n=1 Tax=Saccharopolyspora dendranthemae TaxID=1181886 RepID=A0A561U7A4_9PSEU|nr:gluconate:H+ symporter [Saccharopolyspora dendranthemae]TWF95226.1 GntP family gluconate:H+ symporter [Saccharopolyspora dendranthemae]